MPISYGLGDGSFAHEQAFVLADYPELVAIGDLNQDGAPDLVVARQNADAVSVLLNRVLE